ncbi:MAG: T9SS type A sorting domain-containing protein [Ignavibacteriales bacterium]|nr:T9SS type A sorting domain-containing protein [Ignavibacteriales bacterium]
MIKIIIIFILIVLLISIAQSLDQKDLIAQPTLTAFDGYIGNVSLGNYRMILDTTDFSSGIVYSGDEIEYNCDGIPMKFILETDSVSDITLTFSLPTFLTNGVDTIYCSFDSTSACWTSGNDLIFFDPSKPFNVRSNPLGLDSFYLGMNVFVPDWFSNCDCSLKCSIRINDSIITAGASFFIEEERSIMPVPSEGYMLNLERGFTYNINPGTNEIVPIVNGNEKGESLVFYIEGAPSETINVSFILPLRLFHDSYNKISVTFSDTSLYHKESKLYLDPKLPNSLILNDHGIATLSSGFTVNVSDSVLNGEYEGAGICIICRSTSNECFQELGLLLVGIGTSTSAYTITQFPFKFNLYQNYPNPFNPTTVISYQLPVDSWVTLKVYNIVGQEIATLVDGMQKAGYKSIQFDGSKLPSGIYTYRLNAGGYSEVNKMIILK